MSAFGTWDKINIPIASTTTTFGGEWGNLISDLFNGVDIGLSDPTKKPLINTDFRFKSGKLRFLDSDSSHEIKISADDIDTGSTRNIRIRRMNAPYEEDFMVLEGLSQELFNKTINFANNTISNIPGSAIADASIATAKLIDSANFAMKNAANIFTQAQSIEYDTTFGFTLYRKNATPSATNTLKFDGYNGATPTPARINYGHLGITNTVVTPGAESGSLRLFLLNNAVISETLNVFNGVVTFGISPAKMAFDPAGLTGTRTYTGPNYNGELTLKGITSNQYKEGWCDFASSTGFVGEGLLSSLQMYYSTITPGGQSLQGTTVSVSSGTVANTAVGWAVILTNGITRRSWNPFGFYRTSLNALSSGDSNFYFGFTSRVALLPSGNSPLANNESGVLIGYRSIDTEFKVFHNDGAGNVLTVTPISPSVPVPAASTSYSFEIKTTSTGFVCSVYNSGTTLLGSATVTTAIPATTTNLNFQGLGFNPTGANKGISPTKLILRSEK
jgi:hypothetical protein